ncbi:MAG: hypothetical protein WD492_12670 [Alkalispirochaeta sp.]
MSGDQLDLKQEQDDAVPASWSYQASVDRMRPLVARWKSVTVEMLDELYRARVALRNPGFRTDLSPNGAKLTWSGYLQDIGLAQETVRRWLSQYDPETKSIRAIDPPHDPDPKQLQADPTDRIDDRVSGEPLPDNKGIESGPERLREGESLVDDERVLDDDEVLDTWEDSTPPETETADNAEEASEPESDTPADIICGMVTRYYEDLVADESPSTAHEVANLLLKHFRQVSADFNRRTE